MQRSCFLKGLLMNAMPNMKEQYNLCFQSEEIIATRIGTAEMVEGGMTIHDGMRTKGGMEVEVGDDDSIVGVPKL